MTTFVASSLAGTARSMASMPGPLHWYHAMVKITGLKIDSSFDQTGVDF